MAHDGLKVIIALMPNTTFQQRVHNFNAGPAALPLAVLERVQAELTNLNGAGMSVIEMSHRAPAFEAINDHASAAIKKLLGVGDEYSVLFLQGGASLQFFMGPLNLLQKNSSADYILSGDWGRKALKEARIAAGQNGANVRVAASTQEANFARVPRPEELELDAKARYVHITTNETIGGVQWKVEPETNGVLLVADSSSDILSRPIATEKYGLIYAGAQKNLGPAGVTVVIVKRGWLGPDKSVGASTLPAMLNYHTHLENKSLYNTPNTFGIYMIGLVCEWIESLGGLDGMQTRNREKAARVYEVIGSSEFFRGHASRESRSDMNVTWRLPNEELEKKFAKEAEAHGMIGLKGHRSVGGLRASLYNAVPPESVDALVSFMREFERTNG
jgi:phosphoserine aminotransferase